VNGKVIRNRQNIADFLNNFFLSVVDDNINNNPITNNSPLDYLQQVADHSYPRITYHPVTIGELAEVIKPLKTKGSHRYDEMSIKLLKLCSPFIISPLTYIGNKMLSMGIFPERLKYAKIKPLFKEGCKRDPLNYRPISLLTSFSKIFEKIILSRLYKHVNEYHIYELGNNLALDDNLQLTRLPMYY
jgi:hypothetical protein